MRNDFILRVRHSDSIQPLNIVASINGIALHDYYLKWLQTTMEAGYSLN